MDYLPKVSLFLLLFVASVSGDIKRIPAPQGTVLNCEKLAINPKTCKNTTIFRPGTNTVANLSRKKTNYTRIKNKAKESLYFKKPLPGSIGISR